MLENAAFQYDFSGYIYPEEAKKRLLYRLFNAIGSDNLSTEAVRDFLKNTQGMMKYQAIKGFSIFLRSTLVRVYLMILSKVWIEMSQPMPCLSVLSKQQNCTGVNDK